VLKRRTSMGSFRPQPEQQQQPLARIAPRAPRRSRACSLLLPSRPLVRHQVTIVLLLLLRGLAGARLLPGSGFAEHHELWLCFQASGIWRVLLLIWQQSECLGHLLVPTALGDTIISPTTNTPNLTRLPEQSAADDKYSRPWS